MYSILCCTTVLLYRRMQCTVVLLYCCTGLVYCVLCSLLSPAAQLIGQSLHKPVTVSRKVEGEVSIQSDTGHDWQDLWLCWLCIMAWGGSRVVPAAGSRAAASSVEPAAAEARGRRCQAAWGGQVDYWAYWTSAPGRLGSPGQRPGIGQGGGRRWGRGRWWPDGGMVLFGGDYYLVQWWIVHGSEFVNTK